MDASLPPIPFPHVRVDSDDPFERGRQLGAAAAPRVRGSIAVYDETFRHYTGLGWEDVRALAREFREPIGEYDEEILRELEGIAAGAEVPVDDVLAVNARTEIMFGLAVRPPPECTSFYAGPAATADGHVFLGQNWDWRPRCSATTIVAEVRQGNRPAFATIAEAGLVGKLGFNAAGVGVAVNTLVSELDRGDRGVPFHVLLRGILNSWTIEEAVAAVVRAPRAASANYLIASATGVGVNLETGPGGVDTVFVVHPTDDLLSHSNHFTCAVPFVDTGGRDWHDSPARAGCMRAALERRRGTLTPTAIQEILRDHENYPDSICRHPNPQQHEVEQVTSVASWAVDLTELVATVAGATPCTSEYATLAPSFGRAAAPRR